MRSIERRYSRLDKEAQVEEAIADMFARYQRGDLKPRGVVDSVFKLLRNMLEAVRNAFSGLPARSAAGIMADVASGRVAARQGRGSGNNSPTESIAETGAFQRWFGDSKF